MHNRKRYKVKINRARKMIHVKNSKSVKRWLNSNQIYFNTIVATSLTLMSIIVSVCTGIVSIEQVIIAKEQERIQVNESKPWFIFNEKINQESGDLYTFKNLGGYVRDLEVYMTDDIFIHIEADKMLYIIDINVNGRYSFKRTISKGNDILISITEMDNLFNLKDFIERLNNEITSEESIKKVHINQGRRVIFGYTDYNDNSKTEKFALINDDKQLIRDGSHDNAYYNLRDNQINYDIFDNNQEDLIKQIKNRIYTIENI